MYKIILVLVVIVVSALSETGQSSQHKTLKSKDGRFVYGQVNNVRADQFLLDTQTGQMWRAVENENGTMVLEAIIYVDAYNKKSAVPQ